MNDTILVVEDNPDCQFNFELLLEMNGHDMVVVATAEEALQLLASSSQLPALIISDIKLPGMDGHAFYREVRSHPAWKRIPFIFVTAKPAKEDADRAERLGAAGYFSKPFDPDELLAAVTSILSGEGIRVFHCFQAVCEDEDSNN
ncbi:MAG: response regulator [Candidatus Odinarchaeota archaeon]